MPGSKGRGIEPDTVVWHGSPLAARVRDVRQPVDLVQHRLAVLDHDQLGADGEASLDVASGLRVELGQSGGGNPREKDPALGSGSRYLWPELMRRVFAIDALTCHVCGSRRRWIAAISEAEVITKILDHLGLESTLSTPAPARPRPQEFVF